MAADDRDAPRAPARAPARARAAGAVLQGLLLGLFVVVAALQLAALAGDAAPFRYQGF